jgi:hypothetical protein
MQLGSLLILLVANFLTANLVLLLLSKIKFGLWWLRH